MADSEQKKAVLFPKGTHLFRQGEDSRYLYILKTGKVRVYKTEETVEVDLDTAGAGAVVGEVAAIDGGTRSASVLALEDTQALRIEAEGFQKIVTQLPDWFQKIARILVRRLRAVDEKIDMSKGGDRTVHAAALIALLTYTEPVSNEDLRFEFAVSKLENEIADMLNMGLNEVEAVLEALQARQLIVIERSKVIVPDRAKLEACGDELFAAEDETPAF